VELTFGEGGNAVNAELSEFFDAFSRLSDAPTGSTERQEVIQQGHALATEFNDLAARLAASQREADTQVRATVDSINGLATKIAGLNEALSRIARGSPEALPLQDQVRQAVDELAKLATTEAIERPDGGFDVAIGNGRPLVVGSHRYAIAAVSQPVTGLADVVASDGSVLTGYLSGGRIAGFLHARDTSIPGYRVMLDELAYTVATEVNSLHTAGYDSTGTAGLSFFQPLASSADAASLIAVNPALLAAGGESLGAASNDPLAVGDNGAARAVAALRDSRLLAGGTATLSDYWSRLVYQVGRDIRDARDEESARGELVRQVELLRDSVSGVSLDEEAADLLRFQRAYEANARYFRAVDDGLTTLMNMVGGV
jgi:flagellar hook-associated protein 1 FlgK